ncbi:SRPBCC family protein [Flavobacterium sp. GT3R68]|uniref:SRPBCC family protein n=1 Tax=Flavobacterium sp. GT3R68 TaxID=2594437 RepID=UPI000F898479|nr:SRPBCC family protein [Flavobacterium sp. GT3R68]RTY95180.1 transcriptional regulator [Flavobacterium sp. GSN2]TRW91078.1 transcriptional regulator [Flavobacterium sp. GT3R68]
MRILKYIFLLILLAFVALAVFVATQKGEYDVVRSKFIKSPKSVVFAYVNDYRNWENWGAWKENDSAMRFSYPAKTIGKGGSYSWSGTDGVGKMKTVFVKENDSIVQKMTMNDAPSDVYWSFKDTAGGTNVTWRTKGTMPFMFKIYAAVKGGAEKIIGNMYEKSLVNLDRKLDYEINTYKVKVHGIVMKAGGYYMQRTINSSFVNLPKNMKIMMGKLDYFFKKNKIPTNGKPFVIYHTYDVVNGITKFSVCVPVKDQIVTSPGSEIMGGKLEAFQALKTTLTGDYSHSKEAWDEAAGYISQNNLNRNPSGPSMEVYTLGIDQEKSPSKWVTDIYIAISPKAAVVPITPTVKTVPTPKVTLPAVIKPVIDPAEEL